MDRNCFIQKCTLSTNEKDTPIQPTCERNHTTTTKGDNSCRVKNKLEKLLIVLLYRCVEFLLFFISQNYIIKKFAL